MVKRITRLAELHKRRMPRTTALRMDIKDAINKETGDLLFNFTNDVKLQVLNFTGYEIWQISFPDGTGEYSNYAK
jgi:hypothetical protein